MMRFRVYRATNKPPAKPTGTAPTATARTAPQADVIAAMVEDNRRLRATLDRLEKR